jgi:hypothetical protein
LQRFSRIDAVNARMDAVDCLVFDENLWMNADLYCIVSAYCRKLRATLNAGRAG